MIRACLLVFLSAHCFSQSISVSRYEVRWALAHPVAAIKIKTIQRRAFAIYRQPQLKQELDSFGSGGRLDAFRHVFYMACFAQKIKIKKLRKLGIAHEKTNYRQFLRSKKEDGELADSLAAVMDLRNNELGFAIGRTNRRLDLESLKIKVTESIKAGKALTMKRNSSGQYVDCAGNRLAPHPGQKKWSLPKCLVASNE